jgi:hypothetical protein
MKYHILILCLMLSSPALAQEKNTCRPLDVFTNGMNLNQQQHHMNRDLAELYKEKSSLTKSIHNDRLTMMVDFLERDSDRKQIHTQTNKSQIEKSDQDNELQYIFVELLTSLSTSQQSQLKENLIQQQTCFVQKKANKERTRPRIGEMLFENLSLSNDQQSLIVEVYHDRHASIDHTILYGLHHESLLKAYFGNRLTDQRMSTQFETKMDAESTFRYNQIDALLDLLESFTPDQRTQFINNIRHTQKI